MIAILNSQITLLIGAITIIGLIWGPKAWPQVYVWINGIWNSITYPWKGTERRVLELDNQIKEMAKTLDFIKEQFSPNGGTTIKDSLNRIESKQATNEVMTTYLANAIEVPMFRADSYGQCTWASKEYLKLTGKTIEETLGWGWIQSVHPEDSKYVQYEWSQAVEQKRSFHSIYRIISEDGASIRLNSKATPSIFNGNVISWVGSWEIVDGS